MSTFESLNLAPPIAKAIHACGYTIPTPVQIESIPDILKGRDLVVSARTGTGKTAAFILPALHRLSLQETARKPRILVLTPTRELATQITTAASKYGKFLRFNMASLVGGMPYRQQLRDLSRAVDLIVATPGRLLDHMDNRRLDLSGIEMLILDEADRMLDMGFIDDVQAIAKATPATRQTLLFSATVDGKLGQVVRNLLNDPLRIDLSQEKVSATQIKQELYLTDSPNHKTRLLQHFLDNENMYKAIIFSATKIGADKLAGQLRDQGYQAAALHGDLKQNVRNRTIEQLRSGKVQFLVATDVAARGIDIADMTHVINYDLPRFCEDYVHRIGRTGRAGKTGIAISFALPSDVRHVTKIERFIGQRLQPSTVEGLEPTKNFSAGASEGPKRKRFGGGNGGGKDFKRGGSRSGGDRDFKSRDSGFKRKEGSSRFSDKPAGRDFAHRDSRGSDKSSDREFVRRDVRSGDKPARREFDRKDSRGPSDKPARREFDRSDSRGSSDKPARRSFDRNDSHGSSDKPARREFVRKDSRDSSDKPAFKRRDSRVASSDKPAGREFKRKDSRSASDKPANREFKRKDARSGDKPAGREFKRRDARSGDKPAARSGERTGGRGSRSAAAGSVTAKPRKKTEKY